MPKSYIVKTKYATTQAKHRQSIHVLLFDYVFIGSLVQEIPCTILAW